MEKRSGCTSGHIVFTHYILWGLRKKTKQNLVKSYFEASEIIFFTQVIKKMSLFNRVCVLA
jgi:hypothetical protein